MKYEANNIYNEDCYKAIKEIPDKSIDLIVTDPPYEIETEVKEVMLKQLAIERWDGKLPQTMVGDEFLTWLLGQI